jgi:hypothetical protein
VLSCASCHQLILPLTGANCELPADSALAALEATAASVHLPQLGPAFCLATLDPLPEDLQADSASQVAASKMWAVLTGAPAAQCTPPQVWNLVSDTLSLLGVTLLRTLGIISFAMLFLFG